MPFPQGLAQITRIEQIDRVVHATSSGMEITRTFWVWPYESWPRVTTALRGTVEGGTRIPPARDTYVDNCYCNETRVTMPPDSMASSPELTPQGANEPDDAATVKARIRARRENPGEDSAGDVSFAVVTAHYRPLISAWPYKVGATGEILKDNNGDPVPADERWDWIDPVITMGQRQIRWPLGLFISIDSFLSGPGTPDAVPDDSGEPLTVAVYDVSIRRILVDEVPWTTIAAASGALNRNVFPAGLPDSSVLPKFRPGTLKFAGADIVNMVDAGGNRWYEITYRFKWIAHSSPSVMNALGQAADGWITWNHVLVRPLTATLGWYPVWIAEDQNNTKILLSGIFDAFAKQGGALHTSMDFMWLFRPEPDN